MRERGILKSAFLRLYFFGVVLNISVTISGHKSIFYFVHESGEVGTDEIDLFLLDAHCRCPTWI